MIRARTTTELLQNILLEYQALKGAVPQNQILEDHRLGGLQLEGTGGSDTRVSSIAVPDRRGNTIELFNLLLDEEHKLLGSAPSASEAFSPLQ